MHPTTFTTLILGVVGLAQAHGMVDWMSMDGKKYDTAKAPSIVRGVSSENPILDITGPEIACNIDAEPRIGGDGSSLLGEVTSGSNISFHWVPAWPHSGPIMIYMAKCDPDCGHFPATESKAWFKIYESGYNAATEQWGTELFYNAENTQRVTVPSCLAPGEYLVRMEIIALTDCAKEGKCQFYPACAQVKVASKGTTVPKELVAFPGAYKTTDKGILWDTNSQDPKDYVVPGPKPFTCS
ncbi:lytic polysaccharide monooxygenase [Aulographum hederae CBS 113979]|uniref:AA9 family lytic polysaccharide monooxygenase n=1 Tax=Aulographum hederae CBS 113979 TaxID=1176131 RepID=A0A6G1HH37_9PEZI|nr:lytic polysaccharide monooxygenase [Aulographum hederae CBS 113979]